MKVFLSSIDLTGNQTSPSVLQILTAESLTNTVQRYRSFSDKGGYRDYRRVIQKNLCLEKNPAWYRPVNNSYEYELTDQAPEKARKSYAEYKDTVDEYLALFDATPYEGVIVDLQGLNISKNLNPPNTSSLTEAFLFCDASSKLSS